MPVETTVDDRAPVGEPGHGVIRTVVVGQYLDLVQRAQVDDLDRAVAAVSASRLVCGLTGSHGPYVFPAQLSRAFVVTSWPRRRTPVRSKLATLPSCDPTTAVVPPGSSAITERCPGWPAKDSLIVREATFRTWTPVERVGHDLRATRDQRDPPNPRGRQIGGEGSVPAGAQVEHGDSRAAYWTRNEVFRPSATSRPSAEIAGRPPIGTAAGSGRWPGPTGSCRRAARRSGARRSA